MSQSLPQVRDRPLVLPGQQTWRRFKRDRTAVLGTVMLILIILSVLVVPCFYSQQPTQIDFALINQPPSWKHLFGTNPLGQDQLARVLIGGRISLAVAVAAMLAAISLGTIIGAIAGFFGGWLDNGLMRLTDLFLSLPQLPLLLLLIYLFRDAIKSVAGPELGIFALVVLAIGGLNWMSVARLVRGNVLRWREMEFVDAARALGASPQRLIWTHILPNVLGTIVVAATLAVGQAIVVESTLSFLGLGFPPDSPTWGRMLYDAQNYLTSAPHLALFPGLAIFLVVLSINYVGDGLRDAFDPKSDRSY